MNPNNPTNPKVLMLLTNAFDPDPRVYQEARALVANGYDVTILCWDRDLKAPAYEVIDGIKVERIYVSSTHGRGIFQIFFLLLFWLKACFRAYSKKIDVVHCHDFDTLPLGYVLSRRKGVKLIYDAHESYTDMLGNIPAWLKATIYRAENILLKRTDLLITVGELLRENLAKRGARNTCVVGNWKDPDRFKFSQGVLEKEKRQLNISNGQLVVSFIANLGKERRLSQLVEAVKDTPETFLVIGGNGPCRGMIEAAANKYQNIHYLGYVNPRQVPLYTAMSDIVFYGFDPSNPNAKYSAPNKLFEALAAGKPVLTGNFGEIGRIVREEDCGIILADYAPITIKRALKQLLDGKVYTDLSHNAMIASQRYSWQEAEDRLLRAYSSLYARALRKTPRF